VSSAWRMLSEVYVFLRGLLRYRATLFWVIIFPVIFYGIMAGIWGSPNPPTIRGGVVNDDEAVGSFNMSKVLLSVMNKSGLFKVRVIENTSTIRHLMIHGKIDAGLYIPGNFTESIMHGSPALVKVEYIETRWGSFAGSVLTSFLNRFSGDLRLRLVNTSIKYIQDNPDMPDSIKREAVHWLLFIASPLKVNVSAEKPPLIATRQGLRAYYALSMIGIEALFIGLFSGTETINERKRTGTLRVLLSAPIKSWELLAADTLSALTGILLSAVAVIGFSLATGARYSAPPSKLAIAILMLITGTLSMIGLGLLLAPLARTPEEASVIVNALAFPLMFIGGIAIPPFILPKYLRVFAQNWPLGRAVEAMRASLLFEISTSEALRMGLWSIAASAILYLVGVLVYRRMLNKTIEYY